MVSEITAEDHLIILRELLVSSKAHVTLYIQVQVNCLQASVRLHLSLTTRKTICAITSLSKRYYLLVNC